MLGLFLVAVSRDCSLASVGGLLIVGASLAVEEKSMGSRVLAQYLWFMGLVAPWCVGSSWTRDLTRIPPALTTGPPGKSLQRVLNEWKIKMKGFPKSNEGLGEKVRSNEGHLGKGRFLRGVSGGGRYCV